MPFRGVVKDFKFGEAVKLVVAGPDDVEAHIAIKPYGAAGTSGAPNFWVGGPDIKDELGKLVTTNEFFSIVEPGDELWVMPAEKLEFAESWQITALIRSTSRDTGQDGRHAARKDT